MPRRTRPRHCVGKKALVEDTEEGALLKPPPRPAMERGSLRSVLRGRKSKETMDEVGKAESAGEKSLSTGGGD